MKNLTLNFYSEQQVIPLKKELSSLKKSISEHYNLSLSDVDEIEISYNANNTKKTIKTEIDYKTFLHARISELNLEIKESSKLYKNSLKDLQQKKKDDLLKLNLLKTQLEENKKKQEKESQELKKKLEELNNQIKDINQQKLDYVKSIKKMMRGTRNKEQELNIKITKLGNEIGAPLVYCLKEGDELPVKGENEKEKKYLELIQRNTECVKVQEQLYANPRKNMAGLDKQIKEINKLCFNAIKLSQKKMTELKKEERNLILEIISIQKKIGLDVELKKPMIKTGFYIPKRLHLKTEENVKEENKKPISKEIKLKSKNVITLPNEPQKPKTKKLLRKNIRKKIAHLKFKTKKKLNSTNTKINSLIENFEEKKEELTSEEKEFLSKTKQDNIQAKKEIDDWLKFILSHTKELIASYEQRNDMNIEKLKQIEKKLGNFKKGESLIKSEENTIEESISQDICCSQCKENIVGVRYKCVVCADFNFCEKCEDKFKDEHGHPMLKIKSPDMCPISINCSFIEDK